MSEKGSIWTSAFMAVLMCIIAPPVGIILLWLNGKGRSTGMKMLLTAVFAVWTAVIAVFLFKAPASRETEKSLPEEVMQAGEETSAELVIREVTVEGKTFTQEETSETVTVGKTEATTHIYSPSHMYVLNKRSKKIHYADCDSVNTIGQKNYDETDDFFAALEEGYEPCGRCNPTAPGDEKPSEP